MNRLNYILNNCILDYGFVRYKSSQYDQVYELGKTAVEKFGKDPATFKKTLAEFKPKKFRERIKEEAKYYSSSSLRFDSWKIRNYINCLTAILQVDLECPGFIKNFPEALMFLKMINGNDLYRIVYDYEELYNNTLKPFNRYSGKSDLKYVKSLFEIPEEKKEVRFDDYISIKFLEFWKSGDTEKIDYLKKHYLYSETLLPEDYYELIQYTRALKTEEIEVEKGDLRMVDLYFENIDKVLENAYQDIKYMTPLQMKKINLTLT